jgi:hypothetical protein
MALPAHSGPRPLFQFRNHFSQTVGLLGRVISPFQGRYLNTGQHKHRINAYIHQTFMPWVGFETTIPASERAKTVYTLDRVATVTGSHYRYYTTQSAGIFLVSCAVSTISNYLQFKLCLSRVYCTSCDEVCVIIDGVQKDEWLCLYTRLVGTSNYSATANLHNSQFTRTHSLVFSVC